MIGNTLGIFLEVDMSLLETINRNMAHILVILDPTEGLVEKIHLQLQDYSYSQIIDYKKLPF